MELFAELLVKALENGKIEVAFPDLELDPVELVELKSYAALCRIKKIIEDDSLDDPECFQKIEAIVETLELLGSDGGLRHDFG